MTTIKMVYRFKPKFLSPMEDNKKLSFIIVVFCFLWGLIFFTASASIAQSDICEGQSEPIKIGVILPLSKEDSIYGIPNWFGIITAIRSHSLVLENHCKFKVILYNDEGNKEFASAAAKELLNAGVLAILGSAGSGPTKSILENTKDQVTVISGQASANELKSNWFFRMTIPNKPLAEYVLEFMKQKELSNKQIRLLYNEDNPFSIDLKKLLDDTTKVEHSKAIPYTYNSKSQQEAVDTLEPDDKVLIIITAIDSEAADILHILQKAKKHEGINIEELNIIVFEIHPAIYDTELFNKVTMFTSFDPFDDKRLSLRKFKNDYNKSYAEVISKCYDTGTQCSLINEGIEVDLKQLSNQSSLDLHTLFSEFKNQVYDSKNANPKYLSNKSPSYAVVLGYDQANVLMQAFLSNSQDREKIREKVEVEKYNGALGTYVFNKENHDGTNLPLFIQREPQPKELWLDSLLPQKGFWHDNLQLSITLNYAKETDTVDTTNLDWEVASDFFFKEFGGIINYNPSISYSDNTKEQQNLKTRIKTLAFNYKVSTSFQYNIKPYVKLGIGQTNVETTNKPTQSETSLIKAFGLEIPMVFTKMVFLNFEWKQQTKFPDAPVGSSLITTISAGLKISYPPPK